MRDDESTTSVATAIPAGNLVREPSRHYNEAMTKLLEQAMAELQKLPAETQDDFAQFVLALANEDAFILTAEDEATLAEAEAELARGEAVSSETMRTFWSAHGL